MRQRATKKLATTLDPATETSTAATPVSAEAPAAGPAPRVGAVFVAVYTFTYFGFFLVLFMPSLFSLAYKIQLLDASSKESNLGLVIGIGSLVSLLTGPIFGVISDGTRLRWGRRRPYLVAGLILSTVSAALVALAPNLALVMVGWLIAQLGGGAISAAVNPTLPEHVPPAQRGRLGALSGVASSIAGVSATLIGSFLTGNLLLLFLIPVAVFAIGVVLWLLVIPDAPAPAGLRTPSPVGVLRALAFNPLKHKDFAWVWVGKFALQIGIAFFGTYQLYFLLERLGYSAETAGRKLAVVGGVSLLATLLFTLGGGFLSDKIGRRKPFLYIAAAMVAGGLLIASVAPSFAVYAIGGGILAAGTGAFNSVDLALASEVLPDTAESGKWMSIYYLSGSLAGSIGPLVAPSLLAIGSRGANYTVLFASGGVITLGAAITASRVRGAR